MHQNFRFRGERVDTLRASFLVTFIFKKKIGICIFNFLLTYSFHRFNLTEAKNNHLSI